MTKDTREQADATVEFVAPEGTSLLEFLPDDHDPSDPGCTCAGCTYPLS